MEFYKIDTSKTFEENKLARDKYYTKEVLDKYDKDTRDIIEKCVLNDNKFKLLYDIKSESSIRFIELTQKQYELFLKM